MPERRAIVFLALTFLFVMCVTWIGYNDVSALCALASLLLIIKGESQKTLSRLGCALAAGFIIGLNIFVRMPNILMLSFAFIPVVADVICYKSLPRKTSWGYSVIFICGMIAASAIVLALMSVFGYLDYYLGSIAYIKELASDPNSHHGGSQLITVFINHHIGVFKAALILGVKIACASFMVVLLPWKLVRYACVVLVAGYFYSKYNNYYTHIFVLAGISYMATFIKLASEAGKSNRKVVLTYLSALGLFMCLPLGSNNGIVNIICSSWLMMPITLNFIYMLCLPNIHEYIKKYLPQNINRILRRFDYAAFAAHTRNIFLAFFIAVSMSHAWTYTYRDSAERLTMKHPVNHEKLRFIYTTSERAKTVQELLDAMKPVTNQYEYMLVYDVGCTLHYLLNIKPYMYETWEFLYEPDNFKKYLAKAEHEHSLPLIVKTKETLLSSDWPRKMNYYWNDSERDEQNRAIADNFRDRYSYVKTWENDTFEVWQPKGMTR